ncbi:class I SAM-dependent methyltransferase [Microlunatus soli]|uniref:Methyltransferase domain-containing protein n=1 Tax=Microlunatus soli TaxID=630515 RepID=A0A1H1SM60_9ACTN|nr:class I SAM-dependent methyltransferase [Microlunatus soli]SDS49110.1 Methyltransferase domain-containing protein [Microlunatus soli]
MDAKGDLSRTFDTAAAGYQSARPAYPSALYQDLLDLTGLRRPARLLEIGCGPGKATGPLAGQGFQITALEPGPRLAEEARHNLVGLDVEVEASSFEDWQPTGDRFDLIYAATSWHWVDPEVKWAKAASLLAPGGHLAVFGAGHAFPEGFDPFFTEIQQTYDEIGEGVDGVWPPPPPDQLPDPSSDYEASGYFTVDAVRRYVWAQQYDADSYIALLNTFSGHIAMPPASRERLFDAVRAILGRRPDGLLTRHWVATLVVAHPR